MKFFLLLVLGAAFLTFADASHSEKNELAVVSEDMSQDESSGEEAADDNDQASEQEKNEKLVAAGTKLATVVASLIGLAAGGPVGTLLSIGVTVISYFLTELTKKDTTLWQQIETKVELKIGEKLAEYHVQRLKAEVFKVLEDRFSQPEGFGPADLKVVLDKRHLVFPHNWPVLGWSYELPLGILYWMPFMIAGFQQMIKENKRPACGLANELARTRANIITSMKEMVRKRYQQVHGEKYSSDRVNYPCKKKKAITSKKVKKQRLGGFGGKTECVSIDRLMTWDDGLDGKSFTIRKRSLGWVGDSWDTKINKIRDDTVDFLWKEVIEKVNKYFDPEICLTGLDCECPKKIEKSEITFDFPKACFANGADGTCLHPCDSFGYSYEWCWINRRPDQWSYCTQPDLNDCMPVTVPTITYPNVLPKSKADRLP